MFNRSKSEKAHEAKEREVVLSEMAAILKRAAGTSRRDRMIVKAILAVCKFLPTAHLRKQLQDARRGELRGD